MITKEVDAVSTRKIVPKFKSHNSIIKMHEEKIKVLRNKEKMIKECNSKINEINGRINIIDRDNAVNMINNKNKRVKDPSFLKDEVKTILKKIDYINSGEMLTEYLLNTCFIIQKFIDLQEKETSLIKTHGTGIEETLFEINYQKNNLIDDYKKILDPDYVSTRNNICEDSYCNYCGILLTVCNGHAVCSDCGASKRVIQLAAELSYKEQQEMDYRPQFTYKKSTHLDEWIRRFQAKEHKDIPVDVLDKVILEAYKERVKDLSTLTEQTVKKYLKKLNLNDYYDNVIAIINRINKRPPFILTNEIEDKIKTMFQQIQLPFEKHKTGNRKNMLSYSYILNKFFLILGLPEFSRYFFLLKSADKLRVQDDIFKKIVDELKVTDPKTGWTFYPSV